MYFKKLIHEKIKEEERKKEGKIHEAFLFTTLVFSVIFTLQSD